MKTKKLLSLLLCFVMLLGTITLSANAEDATTTVYVTLSRYGEILTDANGEYLACVPVSLQEENPNLDTVLRQFHALYHENGEDAYSSYEGEYGTAIDMLWEDESQLFGYQVNGGTESVYGLSHTVDDGDYVDVCIYQNKYPATESYTKFDTYSIHAKPGEDVWLNLSVAGYDENWNTVFSPCEGAEITINGEISGCITDPDGNTNLIFDQEGTYVISAVQKKELNEETVTAICAPVCIVTIEGTFEDVLHTLAEKYSSDEMMADGNAYWFAADVADYGKIYADTSYTLSEETKQLVADNVIDMCLKSNKPGDLAKGIITLRSMGFDAKNTYTAQGEHFDIAQKLENLVETDFAGVTNIYTLSYVIIALDSGEEYASDETKELLVSYAAENCDQWLSTEFGTDALSPMLRALAPYADTNEDVQLAIEASIDTLKSMVDEEGMIGNAPSTALAIAGLCAVGVDPKTISLEDKNLIDGLLSQLNEDKDGFIPSENSFATEQGMRALNAYMLYQNGDCIFNFRDFPMEEIHHTIAPHATVIFYTDPENAKVTVDGETAEDNTFYLEKGKYTYKVTKSGYKTEEKKFTVSEEDAQNFETLTFEIELSKKSSGGGGGGGSVSVKTETPVAEKEETIENVETKKTFPDISDNIYKASIEELYTAGYISGTDQGLFMPDNTVTRGEFTVIVTRALNISAQCPSPFADVLEKDWFYSYVNAAYEKGIVAGVSENSFNPYGTITKEEAAVMLCRVAALAGAQTDYTEVSARNTLSQFADYTQISPWATSAMAYCYDNGILDISELNSTPKKLISRAEMAHMILITLKKAGKI